MRPPRQRSLPDDDRLELPPLDGADAPADDLSFDEFVPLDEGPVVDDDAVEGVAALDPLEAFDDAPGAGGDDAGEGLDAALDDAIVEPEATADEGDEGVVDPGYDGLEAPGAADEDDGGEEGPGDDPAFADTAALPPLAGDDDDDTGFEEDLVADTALTPPAFALSHAGATLRRVENGARGAGAALGATLAMALGRDGLFVVGDGLGRVDAEALVSAAPRIERLEAPQGELFTSAAFDAQGYLCLGALSAKVIRATRRGSWKALSDTVAEGRAAGPATVFSAGAALWCLGPHGGLFCVDDERFEGPALVEPAAAFAVDDEGGLWVVTASWGRHRLHHLEAGQRRWREAPVQGLGGAAVSLAAQGDVVLVAGRGGALVSHDGGAHWAQAPALAGATAMVLVSDDDGAPRVIAAIHDAAADRATVLVAAVGEAGLVAARQVPLEGESADEGESDDARVEQIVALDRAGRRVALLTARGEIFVLTRL
ncbi:MAG: hypothetical protein JNK72_05035 [Myxococcales bacterium]|nr:hypothetical protein [Myxococcales bacterium]